MMVKVLTMRNAPTNSAMAPKAETSWTNRSTTWPMALRRSSVSAEPVTTSTPSNPSAERRWATWSGDAPSATTTSMRSTLPTSPATDASQTSSARIAGTPP